MPRNRRPICFTFVPARFRRLRRNCVTTTLFAFAALLCAGLVGCGPKGGSIPGVLRYPINAEPTTLDPALVSDGPTIDLLQNMYQGLVGWSEKNEVTPLVAKELPKISADGKVYTFTIRDGVKFTNGRTVTAEDVQYSITRSLTPKLASTVAMSYLNDIQGADAFNKGTAASVSGIKVINPKTIQITLVGPRAYFLGKLTYPTAYVLPKEVVEKGPKTGQGASTIDDTNAVGCGAFKLASYARQNKVILEANKDYWGGAPKLIRIERPIVPDTKTVRNLYDTGQIDYCFLEKGDYERDRNNPELKDQIKQWDRAQIYYVGLNQTNYAPFKDKRVRQAFAYAIDKGPIIKDVMLDTAERAEGIVPKGIPGYDPKFKGLPYDPAKAKALLAAAGFPGGKGLPPLALTFRESQPDLRKAAEVMQQQLAAVGINITLSEMEWGAFLKATDKRQVDMLHMRWAADYLDPQDFLSMLLITGAEENRTAYSNKQFDALCRQADAGKDWKTRLPLYAKAQSIMLDDAPWIPLYYARELELMRPNVKNVRDGLMGHLPHTTTTVE